MRWRAKERKGWVTEARWSSFLSRTLLVMLLFSLQHTHLLSRARDVFASFRPCCLLTHAACHLFFRSVIFFLSSPPSLLPFFFTSFCCLADTVLLPSTNKRKCTSTTPAYHTPPSLVFGSSLRLALIFFVCTSTLPLSRSSCVLYSARTNKGERKCSHCMASKQQ